MEFDYPDPEPFDSYSTHNYPPLYQKVGDHDICQRKVLQPNQKYKRCALVLTECDYCHASLCPSPTCIPSYERRSSRHIFPSQPHQPCVECAGPITCFPFGFCRECETHHTYDMITDHVAIGSRQASYDGFDIVVNMDYPYNHVLLGSITHSVEGEVNVLRCGFEDGKDGMPVESVTFLLNVLDALRPLQDTPMKILFHCYAGISRSATAAILYLAKQENVSTKNMLAFVQQKRPRVCPNPSFQKELLGIVDE